jgi:hypothetical protein
MVLIGLMLIKSVKNFFINAFDFTLPGQAIPIAMNVSYRDK